MDFEKEFSMEMLEKLSKMARISLSDEEKQVYLQNLRSMIAYASILPREVPPTVGAEADAFCGVEDLREDNPAPCLTREALMDMAPEQVEGYFSVLRAVEG